MKLTLQEKILKNVLEAINKGGTGSEQAPDDDYLKALECIGYITIGWDTTLTPLGSKQLNSLRVDSW